MSVRLSAALLALAFASVATESGRANAQQAPATPSSVSVTRSDGALSASWPAVSGATSYHVTYSSDGGGSWSLAALNHPDNSITIGVDNALTYLVGVRARNKHGDSGWRNSPSSGPYTPPPSPPGTPASVSLTRGDGTLSASWPAVSGATSYHVTYSSDGGGSWSLAALNHPGNSITIGVDNANTYVVGVRARNGHGDSGWRNSPPAGPYTPKPAEPLSVTLSVNPSTLGEDAGAMSVMVTATASSAVAANTPVTVSIGGGTATAGTDYTASVAELALDIPAGGTTGVGTFMLTPVDDTEIEGKETISISGSASGLTVNGTSLTLTDKEEVSAEWYLGVKLRVEPGSVPEDGGARKVTVYGETSIWGVPLKDPRVVEVTVGKSGDSAVSGTDYKAVSKFNVTVPVGRQSGSTTFYLQPFGDAEWEGNETITIHGKLSRGSDGVGSTTLTITDDNDQPYTGSHVFLSVNPSKVSEADSAKTVTVTATSDPMSVSRRVMVSVGGTGSATWGGDYKVVNNFNITLPANARSATGTFTLTPIQDTLAEGEETIGITGQVDGRNGNLTGTTLTLVDDEPAPDVTLSVNPSSVSENGGAKTVTVTATSPTTSVNPRTVLVGVGHRTNDTATPGTDYALVPFFDITVPANAKTATGTFTLTPTDDALVENTESISINGVQKSLGAVFTVAGTSMTLTDDESLPAVTLSANPPSVGEGDGLTTVTLTATAESSIEWARAVTVTVGDTLDTAIRNTDYETTPNFDIAIAAGQTTGSVSFPLRPIQDTTNEGDETITVSGQSPRTTVTGTTLTLADDDIHPAVTLSANPSTVSESAGKTLVTVTATAASAITSVRTVTVTVGSTGTATSGTDFLFGAASSQSNVAAESASNFTITIPANTTSGTGTFNLTPTQDTAVEGGETVGVDGASTGTMVTGTTVMIADDDSLPAVTLSLNPASVSEGASATSVTVTATAASSIASARTVTVSVGQTGTATSGADYAAVTDFSVTIAANATSGTGTFTLTPTPDALVEGSETIGVDGTSPNATVTGATMTLTDANPKVTLSANPSSVGEGASATSVTVTATANATDTSARTVTVSVGGGTAASGTDYAAVSDFTVTIAANKTSGTGAFTLTPTNDTAVEGNETIGLSGTGARLTVTGTSVTLTDDDQHPAVTLSAKPASVTEDASTKSVTVTATSASAISSARTVTVSVGQTGTATSGADYAAVADFSVTIAANATSGTGTFTLTPIQDTALEGNESIGVSGTSPSTTVTGTKLTLADDDRPGVSLSVNPSSVGEGASATSVTVTATANTTHSSARTVSVSVGGAGDSATEGADYASVNNFTITIAANATTGTGAFTLTPTQDTIVEGDEMISVGGNAAGLVVNGASLTLTDDENRVPNVSMSTNVSSWSEGGGAKTVTVSLNRNDVAENTPVNVTISVGQFSDDAYEGTDYETVSDFTIKIEAYEGAASGTFTLTPKQDSIVEGTERITILGTPDYSGWTVNSRHLNLTDDDTYAVTLSANPSSVSEGASSTQVTVTATAAAGVAVASAQAVTVSVGGSGTAAAGTDYIAVSNFTVVIPSDATTGTGTFTLTPTDDRANEADETIGVGGSGAMVTVTGTDITLTDNDEPYLGFSASSVKEGDSGTTTLTVTAQLTDANGKPESSEDTVTGNWKASSETGDTATSGTDYTAATGSLAFAPGETEKTFDISVTGDTVIEADETFTLRWTGWSNALLAHYRRTATIEDDDTPAAPTVTLSAAPSSVSEGASAASVTVTATANATDSSARTVTVSVGGSGTATSGTDYTAVSDFTITIAANAISGTGTFTLTPTQDTAVEGSEMIGVSGSATGLTVTGTSLTLTDDDSHPAVTLTAKPASVGEQAPGTAVTVTASAASAISTARTVSVSVGDTGTASSGTDYAVVSDFDIMIAANATSGTGTFTLAPIQDTALEGDETIGVAGASPSTTVKGTTLTLADDDRPTIALATVPTNLAVAEGAGQSSVTVRATAAAPMTAATTVTLTVGASGDSATKGTDYSASNVAKIKIPKGQARAEAFFELAPVQDTLVESDETISVSGSSSGGNTVTGTSLTLTDDDSYPAVTLSASPSSVAEGASGTTVTVTATAASAMSSARTVTVSLGGTGTATSGTDYAAVSDFTVTIAANAKTGTGTFTLTPTQDTTVEGGETIGVAGTSTQSTVTGTTLTLTDDDSYPAVTLSTNPASVNEGASATSVTVTATAASAVSSARTVTVSVGGTGTASRGTDYATVADFTVTIAANAKTGTGTFTLTPTQDTAVEGSETIGLAGASPSSTVTATTVTLTDDDTHAITLSTNPSSVSESKASETVTVTAAINVARTSATTVTVSVGEATDQATSGTDYKAVPDFTITIAANKTSGTGTFTFEPKTDTAYEGFESVTIGGTTSSGGGGSNAFGANAANSSIPVTNTSLAIHDASNYPAVSLSVAPSSVSEGAGATSVTVTATAASAIGSSREVTVSVGGSGTATSGTDYTAVSDFIVKIAANATTGTGTFTLTPTDDSTVEASETIGVAGSSLSTTVTGTTLTLTDNDSAEVTVNNATEPEGDDMTFTVTLDTAVAGGLTVTPSFTDVTATEGADYDENTTAISFSGNAAETKTFTVSTTQDTVVESDETFTVGLTVSGTTLTGSITSTDTGTGTIESGSENNVDDATLTINDASADEGDSMTFTVTLSEAVQGGLTVTPSFTDVTAVEGTDYDENTTGLSFTGTKGETKTFTVSTDEDAVLEADETFTVSMTVSGTTLGDRITSTDTGTGMIDDDDSAAVTVNDANADEGNSMTFTVTLGAAVQGGLTVTPDFTDGTTVEGTDYDENTTALSFTGTANETKTITVSTTEDAVVEGNETFTVGLTVSGTSLSVTATDTGTGTINNDDGAVVTVNNANASEGDDITFTVTLGAAVQGGLTVTPDFTDVTAVEGTDYDENTTALSFTGTANETKTFTVSTTEDAVLEANETFTVGLSTSNSSVTATDTGTGTINNDDSAEVTINDASADEGDSMTFTVTLDKAVQGGLKVTPGYTDGTAASGDYTRNTTALSFTGTANETKTFTVSTTEDAVLEADETFTVGLTVSGTTLSLTATDTGSGTVNNDDGATVTVNDASADEGDSMTFTVTLGAAVQGGLKVTPGYTNGTAADTDYTKNTTALSFSGTKGETKTFSVATTEDNYFEGDETFTVDLTVSGTSLSLTATDTGAGAIDNDDSEPEVNLSLNPSSVGEGAPATQVTVTAAYSNSTVYEADRTVTVSVGGSGTATSGTDYAAVANFDVGIAKRQSSGTAVFTLTPTQDSLAEAAETIGVAGSTTGLTVNGATLTLADDDTRGVTVSLASVTVAENGGTATYTVVLTSQPTGPVRVTPASAEAYIAKVSGPLTFTVDDWSKPKTVTVTALDDDFDNADWTTTIYHTVAGGDYGAVPAADVAVTVTDDDARGVKVAPQSLSAPENGGTATYTVVLESMPTVNVTVTPASSDGSVAAVSGALTFTDSNWSTPQTVTVTGVDDSLVNDPDRTATVSHAVAGGAYGNEPAKDVTFTALDDDAVVVSEGDEGDEGAAVSVSDASAQEGGALTFTATLDAAVEGGFTLRAELRNETTSERDFSPADGHRDAVFDGLAGETQTFTVATADDTEVEGDETFTLHFTVLDGAGAGQPASAGADQPGAGAGANPGGSPVTVSGPATGTIIDDEDTPSVNLSLSPSSVSEDAGATAVAVTATLSNPGRFAEARTVTVSVGSNGDAAMTAGSSGTAAGSSGSAAVPGADYESVPAFDIEIAAGRASGTATFTLSPVDDDLVEGDESIAVSGTSTGLTVNSADLTLADDEDTPSVDLSLSPSGVPEGAGATAVTVTATLSNASRFADDRTVTVTLGSSGDTAAPGTDYGAATDFDIMIAAGRSSGTGTFTLSPVDDDVVEGDELIAVSGTSTGLTVNSASLALTDDDAAPSVDLSLSPSGVPEGAGATAVTVTATLSNASRFADDRTVTVTLGSSGDTAAPGTDYAAVSDFEVTIPAGQASGTGTFTLSPVDDDVVEGDELIAVSGTSTGLTVNSASLALADDDATPSVDLSLSPSGVSEDAGATAVSVTATLSNASRFTDARTVTVSVGSSGDTAVSGADYGPVTDFDIEIAAGRSSGTGTFTLTPVDNAIDAADKLIAVTGLSTGLTVNSASLALADDDATPSVDLSLSPSGVSEGAGATAVAVTATLSNASRFADDRTVTVTLGSSGDTAAPGTDYAAVSDFEVTIPAGRSSGTGTFTLSPVDDDVVEGDELIAVSGTSTGLTVNSASLALADDDATPSVDLSLSPSGVSEDAGATAVSVTATLSNASRFTDARTVTVSVGSSGDTAVSGADYGPVTDFDIEIAAGRSSGTGTFTLTPVDNAIDAADKLIAVTGLSTGLTVNSASLALADDDATPSVDLSLSPSGVSEGAGATAVAVTATLSNASRFADDRTVTVTLGSSGDTAAPGTDYAAVSDFEVTIPAGRSSGTGTFTLSPVDDDVVEGDELIAVSGTSTGLTVNSASLALADDDATPSVDLSLSPSGVSEDAGATAVSVTATLSNASRFTDARTVTVSVGSSGDTAVSGADYGPVTDFDIEIAAGRSSGTGTFTLTPVDNAIDAADKLIAVTGLSTGLTVNSASLALADDDATPSVDLSLSPSGVSEGAGATAVAVTATLSNASRFADDRTVTVTLGSSGDTAVSGTDYAAVPAFDIEIAAGQGSGTATFTLRLIDNDVAEGDKSLTVTGSASGVRVSGDGETVTLADDDAGEVGVAGASTEEGGVAVFRVTVSAPSASAIELAWRTVDGTATAADADYAPVSGATLTIPAGETGAEIAVATLEDRRVEPDETFEVRLAAAGELPPNIALATASAEGAVLDDDAAEAQRLMTIHEPILADVSLSMVDSVTGALAGRLERNGSPCEARGVELSGLMAANAETGSAPEPAPAVGERRPGSDELDTSRRTPREALGSASFSTAPFGCGARSRGLTLWGQGDLRDLSGAHAGAGGSVNWDGELFGRMVGADLTLGRRALAGAALAGFGGEFAYSHESGGRSARGVYETDFVSVHPYAAWTAREGLDLWALGGFGEGELRFREDGGDGFGLQRADGRWRTAAVGGAWRLNSSDSLLPGGATTLDLKSEAWSSRLSVADNGGLVRALDVDTRRLRLGLVGGYTRALASGARIAPSLELGARHDAGVGQDGAGVELGAGLRFTGPGGRFSFEGRVHALLAHRQDQEEFGISGSIRLEPRPDGRGFSFSLTPGVGAESRGPGQLWERRTLTDPTTSAGFDGPGRRMKAALGYGLSAMRGLLTLRGGVTGDEGRAPRYTVGGEFEAGELSLQLEVDRMETLGGGPEHGIMLSGNGRF